MAGWEQELDLILSKLGVQQEEVSIEDFGIDQDDFQQGVRSTLHNVKWLLEEAELTQEMRDDITVTLHFLRHAEMETEQEQLARTQALLRFCRIVLAIVGDE